ncbi:unnamed protein product [Anisakis simplex]|uniref:Putative ammonium transporter 2 (inferred by orthology to a C. elegans protein) n=1 Tax=Anisakis simplex TaxID=6269 RepID=A0A0M3JG89_ANISI|nr:unnamed protein product [Anisakis simplex]
MESIDSDAECRGLELRIHRSLKQFQVHLVGGAAGLAATLFLGPRTNRFGEKGSQQMSNPTNAVLGTFMLWWGWLAFNTGSTYGISLGRWRLAARFGVLTGFFFRRFSGLD